MRFIEPVHAFSIFSITAAVVVFSWKGEYALAIWNSGVVGFLIYLEFYKRSKSNAE